MSSAKVKSINGNVKLFIDEKETAPLIYTMTDSDFNDPNFEKWNECIAQFGSIGINLVSTCIAICIDWKDDGSDDGLYTGEFMLKRITEIVKANKDAKILIRLRLTPPYWWMRKFPDELMQYYGVRSVDNTVDEFPTKDYGNEYRASFVSKKWWADVNKILVKIVDILDNHPLGQSVIGIQPAYGLNGEWHIFGKYYGNPLYEGDYSKPMVEFFREYLKDKYKTVEALQRAWGEKVTFETAGLASPEMRKAFVEGEQYRLPETNMRALDSLKCLQLGAPMAIKEFAKTLKVASKNRLMVGVFYGYHFGCGDVYFRLIEPQLLFEDKNIDFLAAPSAYTKNKRSGMATFLRYLAESVRLNGKLFLCEMDQGYRSYSCYRDDPGNAYVCENNDEYNALMTRNVVENLIRGMGAWFFDHRHPDNPVKVTWYWDEPERLEAVKKVREFADKLLKVRPKFTVSADVLVVYDTETIYHLGPSDMHNTYFQFDLADALAKSGAGVDLIYSSDLEKCELDKYKCVVFMNCLSMTSKTVNFIHEKVMAGGRTVAFIERNGYIVDGKTSLSNMTDLYKTSIHQDRFEEDRGDYKFVSIPQFRYDRDFFNDLFKKAGAHIYTDGGEVLCVDNGLIMVHSFDKKKTVLNLKNKQIELPYEKYFTGVFDLETGENLFS